MNMRQRKRKMYRRFFITAVSDSYQSSPAYIWSYVWSYDKKHKKWSKK